MSFDWVPNIMPITEGPGETGGISAAEATTMSVWFWVALITMFVFVVAMKVSEDKVDGEDVGVAIGVSLLWPLAGAFLALYGLYYGFDKLTDGIAHVIKKADKR